MKLAALLRCVVAAALLLAPQSSLQAVQKHKTGEGQPVEGAFFATDGRIPNGPCFRMTGQASETSFFQGLVSIEYEHSVRYMRGGEEVTEYPPVLDISIVLHDLPCSFLLKDKKVYPPLTRDDLNKLKLKLFWKRGVALRPAEHFTAGELHIRRLSPEIRPAENDLLPRYEWSFLLKLPSQGVPLEDRLVITFQTQSGEIVARTSAKL